MRAKRDALNWMKGKLTSVYNLTQIADDSTRQQRFLDDLAACLDCRPAYSNPTRPSPNLPSDRR